MSADLEQGFADDPAAVADTVRGAMRPACGCSIEDHTRRPDLPIYDGGSRSSGWRPPPRPPTAARSTWRSQPAPKTTSRRPDLSNTIARLEPYQQAGADCATRPG